MLDPIFQSGNFQLAQKLLDGAALRQQAIAANIANAETPGYRRVDVAPDFAEHLKSSFQSGDRDALADTVQPKLTEDSAARSTRPDGNTVDLTGELLAMDKNSVDYSYLTEVVSQNIKQLKIAITGTPA
jgi:flagellar basal-body rod protein FlgB